MAIVVHSRRRLKLISFLYVARRMLKLDLIRGRTKGAPEYAAGLWSAAILRGRINAVNDRETARVPRPYMA